LQYERGAANDRAALGHWRSASECLKRAQYGRSRPAWRCLKADVGRARDLGWRAGM